MFTCTSLHSFTFSFQLNAIIDLQMDFPPFATAKLCVTRHNAVNVGTELTVELNSGDLHLFL